MANLPPGIMINVDSYNFLLGLRGLKIRATQAATTDPATITITFDIAGAVINRGNTTVSDMKGKSHFAFLSGSDYIDHKANLEAAVEPIDPTIRGIVETFLSFSFTNGKVGGAGPSVRFKKLASNRKKGTKK